MSVMNTELLDGKTIKLVPIDESHAEGLARVLRNPDIWEFTWRKITSDEQVQGLISTALANQKTVHKLPLLSLIKQRSELSEPQGLCIRIWFIAMRKSDVPGSRLIIGGLV